METLATSPAGGEAVPNVRYGALTDVGRARDENQDAFAVEENLGLYIVSDGIGGAHAGALASTIVAEILPQRLHQEAKALCTASDRKVSSILRQAISTLSREVYRKSAGEPGLNGMGATVVAALIRPLYAHIVHMGDSRAYRFRNGQLKCLTEDHSVVALLVRNGEISASEAQTHPARSQLTRFVGMPHDTRPDVQTLKLDTTDRLLLCTDGLTGMVSEADIAHILSAEPDPQRACQKLVAAANRAGGKDNITALLIETLPHVDQ